MCVFGNGWEEAPTMIYHEDLKPLVQFNSLSVDNEGSFSWIVLMKMKGMYVQYV